MSYCGQTSTLTSVIQNMEKRDATIFVKPILQSVQYFCIHNVEYMKLRTEVCLLTENRFQIESSIINSTIFNH